MSVNTEESVPSSKGSMNTLSRSKGLFKAISPLFAPKSPINKVKSALDSDRIQPHIQPSQRVKKVSVDTLSTPFFRKLFGSSEVEKQHVFKKATYAQPYFLWKTKKRSKTTPEFLLFERFEEKVEEYPDRKLVHQASLELEGKGDLKKTTEGFVFLDISDDFIEKLFPHILGEGAHKPFFPMGAHIPVISCEESEIYNLSNRIEEVDQTFRFSLKNLVTIYPNSNHLEKVWALTIESTELMQLREKYHLTSKLCSQDFMIIIGARPRAEKFLDRGEGGYFRINPAQLQA